MGCEFTPSDMVNVQRRVVASVEVTTRRWVSRYSSSDLGASALSTPQATSSSASTPGVVS